MHLYPLHTFYILFFLQKVECIAFMRESQNRSSLRIVTFKITKKTTNKF